MIRYNRCVFGSVDAIRISLPFVKIGTKHEFCETKFTNKIVVYLNV